MIEAKDFFTPLLQSGFRMCSAVPCSFLTPIINAAISSPELDYVSATNEGEAVGIACGAWLAGRDGVVMCQNSGLGNTVNALATLAHPFRIPLLLIVTWRGGPTVKDEPQHQFMGEITPRLLESMDIPWSLFPSRSRDVADTLAKARAHMAQESRPYALIMQKGDMAMTGLDEKPFDRAGPGHVIDYRKGDSGTDEDLPTRVDILRALLDRISPDTAIVASTGKCGRELFELEDRKQHFYQVGSMGCASAVALGIALYGKRQTVVLDGDGAALMNMGNMATIGSYRPKRHVHVLLDNAVHDSTGGQATVSTAIDFPALALACGYDNVFACNDLPGWNKVLSRIDTIGGPSFVHMRIAAGSIANLGRPTVGPDVVARRFRRFLIDAD